MGETMTQNEIEAAQNGRPKWRTQTSKAHLPSLLILREDPKETDETKQLKLTRFAAHSLPTLRDPKENDGTKQAKPTGLPALSLQTLGDPKQGGFLTDIRRPKQERRIQTG